MLQHIAYEVLHMLMYVACSADVRTYLILYNFNLYYLFYIEKGKIAWQEVK